MIDTNIGYFHNSCNSVIFGGTFGGGGGVSGRWKSVFHDHYTDCMIGIKCTLLGYAKLKEDEMEC